MQSDQCRGAALYVVDCARTLIDQVGPRAPGSEGENAAAHMIAKMMQSVVDEVRIEPFTVHPTSFYGYIKPVWLLFILSSLLYWIDFPILSWCVGALAFLVVMTVTGLYWRTWDFLFPSATSHNVIGVKRAPAPTKTLIIGGHVDAAWQWRWNYYGRFWLILFLLSGIVGCLWFGIATIPIWQVPWPAALVAHSLLLPLCTGWAFFIDWSTVVPGANDNLSGVFCALAIGKLLAEGSLHLQSTNLVLLATGCEEAGLRGAKAYVKAHKNELANGDVVFLALETLHDRKFLSVMHRDLNFLVGHDKELCSLVHQAGTMIGTPVKSSSIFLGASDAAAFTQAGVRSCCIAAMDPSPAHYYHTIRDTWQSMDTDTLSDAIAVIAQTARLFDDASPSPFSTSGVKKDLSISVV
ncbi:M20/M25/M40 family metallo-hydrolase [Pelomyxa schiedti]|nr:M20/M25/M40 family metallo-hydrolase [Pelomyxa schiedti]